MQVPTKAENIYPRNIENIRSIFQYFFPKHPHSKINELTNKLYDERKPELIEIEEVARQVNRHFNILQKELRKDQITPSNAFHYGEDALINYPDLNGSKNRNRITPNLRTRILSLDNSE